MDKEKFHKNLHLHHLSERWSLLKYYIIIYGVVFWFQLTRLPEIQNKETAIPLFISAALTIFFSFFLFALDRRMGNMIQATRPLNKENKDSDPEHKHETAEDLANCYKCNKGSSSKKCCFCFFCRSLTGRSCIGKIIKWMFIFMGALQLFLCLLSLHSFCCIDDRPEWISTILRFLSS